MRFWASCRQHGNYPQTGFWETMRSTDDVLEADFWTGTSGNGPIRFPIGGVVAYV